MSIRRAVVAVIGDKRGGRFALGFDLHSHPHQWSGAKVEIIDATGDYACLRGDGRLTVVVDVSTNQPIGAALGHAH